MRTTHPISLVLCKQALLETLLTTYRTVVGAHLPILPTFDNPNESANVVAYKADLASSACMFVPADGM